MTETLNRLARATVALADADNAWIAAYQAICPRGTWPGDFRYTDAATGEPGTTLRARYDAWRAANDEYHAARKADAQERARLDAAVRSNPDLIGKAAYAASLAAAPLYHDGTPRPAWDDLGNVARWSWERPPRTST